jgi:hypothetical protein
MLEYPAESNNLLANKCCTYSLAPVVHAYTPTYSGGRDQEDCSLKPDGANTL